ncbi:glycosyltransferase [Pseudomonas putida]
MERIDRLLERMDQLTCAVERKTDASQQLLKDIVSRDQLIEQLRDEQRALTEQLAHLRQQLSAKQSELLTLSDWAISMDRAPLRYWVRKLCFRSARFVYARLPLSPAWRHRLAQSVRRWRKGSSVTKAQSQALSTLMTSAPQTIDLEWDNRQPAALIFGVIDWHFRIQRPQNLAKELARAGQPTFYLSNHFIDHERPGFVVEPLDGIQGLFQIRLHLASAPPIYHAPPTQAALQQLRQGLAQLLQWAKVRQVHCIVQHAYWFDVAKHVPDSTLIYDCMDHHEGFGNVGKELLDLEKQLMRRADLVVATSTWIEQHCRQHNEQVTVIRNAAEYSFFCRAPEQRYQDPHNRKIIGYYGAIAEWFDLQLVKQVAQAFPQHLVLLIGNDTTQAKTFLKACPNVLMHSEVPYSSLPHYLYAMDVCLLPFKVIPLTLATNPVKAYEYLSAGKPVVSVMLPEMAQFGPLVSTAQTPAQFVSAIQAALEQPENVSQAHARRQFAQGETWAHRAAALRQAIDTLSMPKVSVVVLTYNNMDLTQACLDSLLKHSNYPNLEIIVVDNHSTDGTPGFLEAWAEAAPDRIVILNTDNKGFAAGNNQGLAAATGDYLVVLNNDTIVTAGWIKGLMRHLMDNEDLGLIGPVTNNIGNEARMATTYTRIDDMHTEAGHITRTQMGQWFEIHTLAFFCVMLRRATYEQLGGLCEDYGLGFFEDDDYCRRLQHQGLRIGCARDVFVHHHLSASFNKLGADVRQALFERNKAIYERKWGQWAPHRYREA